jgi:hypothetical protein
MIYTFKDLQYYKSRDMLRYNSPSLLRYIIVFFLGEESSCCIRFLRVLRNTEFLYNNRKKSPIHLFLYVLMRIHLKRVSFKYKIYVGLNTCGPELRIVHISGGTYKLH